MTDTDLDDALARWVRSGRPDPAVGRADPGRLLHRIDLNGIGPLLAREMRPGELPPALSQALQDRRITREMWEAQHRRVLGQALDALHAAGLHPVIIKGTALAWTHYAEPALRVRGDSDLVVEPSGRERAFAALAGAGFTRVIDASGEVRVAEALFCKADMAGNLHDIDLHWALNSSAVLAPLFPHDEMLAAALPVPRLWPGARAMGAVQSLIFTCVHRLSHLRGINLYYLDGEEHAAADSLIWLMDIHLLFGALAPEGRAELVRTARDKGVLPVLATGLRAARTRLGTEVPESLLRTLEAAPGGAVARYLEASLGGRMARNLAATPGIRRKLQFVTETLFPDPDYMHRRFPDARLRWLPWLYLRRGLGFLGARLRGQGRT